MPKQILFDEQARAAIKRGVDKLANAVKITYQAGYASAAAVPRRIKLLMLLMIADLYKYRGAISIEDFIDSLPYLKSLLWSARNIEIY